MFRDALVFNQDISGWAIDSLEHMALMFYGWCVGHDAFEYAGDLFPEDVYWGATRASLPDTAFSGTVCAPTMCGVTQGGCPP